MRSTIDRPIASGSEADTFAFVPVIEDLDIPATSVDGRLRRRTIVAIAMAGAIVGYGFIGGDRPPDGDPAAERPVGAAPIPVPSAGAPAAEPMAIARTASASVWRIAGVTEQPIDRVVIEARLGALVLGRVESQVAAGHYAARLRILLRGTATLPVDVVVEDGVSGRALSRRTIGAEAPPMAVEGTVTHLASGSDEVHLSGTADLSARELAVEIRRGGLVRTLRVPVNPVAEDAVRPAADALGLGRWFVTAAFAADGGPFAVRIDGGGPLGTDTISLVLPADGGPLRIRQP
jgi:hypothetical protein